MRSKAKADAALAGLIGRGSYGGTSLMRGLAGLPLVLPLPGKAAERFQPIAADDLAHGIAHLAARDEPARTTLYAAGTETVSIRDILVAYRAWLGFGRAPEGTIPLPLLSLLLRFGDIAGFLGHDTSARSTFSETLAAWPATLQDRLHARSFFAVPLLQVTLALFWILTGILTLTPRSFAGATALISDAGFDARLAAALVGVASVTDIVVGALFLLPHWVRRAGVAQLVLSTIYLVGLSLVAPALWIVASLALYIVIAGSRWWSCRSGCAILPRRPSRPRRRPYRRATTACRVSGSGSAGRPSCRCWSFSG